MMYKSYVMTVILSLAGLLLTTDVVQARHRGGCCGCYGGGYGCYGGCYGCYGGCYGGCYRSYGGCYGGCYGGYYGGGYAGTYGYYGGISTGTYPGYVTSPGGTGTFVSNPNNTTNLSFYAPNEEANGPSQAIPNNAARIRVILPDPQARVWVDGSQTSSTGAVRMFHTPALSSGGTYRVKMSATVDGREMTRERSVTVNPGQTAVLDFNQLRQGTEDDTRPAVEKSPARTPQTDQ